MIRPALRIPGSKLKLSKWILAHFPSNYETYIEPFVGTGAIFLNSPKVKIEIINDLNPETCYVYNAIKNNLEKLKSELELIKVEDKIDFLFWKNFKPFSHLSRAVKELVLRRFSINGLGKDYAFSSRTRRGLPEFTSSWLSMIDELELISTRLQNTQIHNNCALKLINFYKTQPKPFFYIDPPYLKETRSSKNLYGSYEVGKTKDEEEKFHSDLAATLLNSGAKFLVSHYECSFYDNLYKGCTKVTKKVSLHASITKNHKNKKIETLYMNY